MDLFLKLASNPQVFLELLLAGEFRLYARVVL
jgi:hypothetical protein